MQVATSTIVGNSANYGQPDHGDATNGANDTNIKAMLFGARWGMEVPNLFIEYASSDDANCGDVNNDNANCDDANCDDASCDDASCDDASYDDASCDDANCDDANCDDASCNDASWDDANYDDTNSSDASFNFIGNVADQVADRATSIYSPSLGGSHLS